MTTSTHSSPVAFRWVEFGPDDQMALAQVLRGFDEMRRDLAVRSYGDEGIGLGYDVLDIHWGRLRGVGEGSRLALTASVAADGRAGLKIEYTASLAPIATSAEEPSLVLVRARGWSPPLERSLATSTEGST